MHCAKDSKCLVSMVKLMKGQASQPGADCWGPTEQRTRKHSLSSYTAPFPLHQKACPSEGSEKAFKLTKSHWTGTVHDFHQQQPPCACSIYFLVCCCCLLFHKCKNSSTGNLTYVSCVCFFPTMEALCTPHKNVADTKENQ